MLEANVVDKVRKRFASTGWISRKMRYEGRRGAPDIWFFGPGARLVIIEFKRPGKGARKQQGRGHTRLSALGFPVHVIDTIEGGYALHARLEREYRALELA